MSSFECAPGLTLAAPHPALSRGHVVCVGGGWALQTAYAPNYFLNDRLYFNAEPEEEDSANFMELLKGKLSVILILRLICIVLKKNKM